MKKALFVIALCLGMALPAQAEVNGFYVGAKFLDSIQSNGNVSRNFGEARPALDTGSQNTVGGGIFAGYDFFPKFQIPIRAELEYAVRSMFERDRGTVNSSPAPGVERQDSLKYQSYTQTLFANVYYDFHNSTAFTPYIGAGIGMGFIHSSLELHNSGSGPWGSYQQARSATAFDTVFAWNVGVGCAYSFNENVALDLSYRYVGFGPTEIGYPDELPTGGYETHSYNTVPNAHEFALGIRITF